MAKFKDALDDFEENGEYNSISKETEDTIRLALRIAQAVTDEPSIGMMNAYFNVMEGDNNSHSNRFRAMIEQMMKELSD